MHWREHARDEHGELVSVGVVQRCVPHELRSLAVPRGHSGQVAAFCDRRMRLHRFAPGRSAASTPAPMSSFSTRYNSASTNGFLDGVEDPALEVRLGDVADPFLVRELSAGVDTIFHLAALIGIPYSYEAPAPLRPDECKRDAGGARGREGGRRAAGRPYVDLRDLRFSSVRADGRVASDRRAVAVCRHEGGSGPAGRQLLSLLRRARHDAAPVQHLRAAAVPSGGAPDADGAGAVQRPRSWSARSLRSAI